MSVKTIYKTIDRETIASVASAIGFTAAKLTVDVIYAIAQPLSGDVRYTEDGTTPTSSVGMKLVQNGVYEVWGYDALHAARFIDDGGTATVEVIYMGRGAA